MLNYPASMTFNSRRSAVVGTNGMVATSQPLAVSAGLQILKAGGNAADAAVAVAAALNVTEPTSTGIGGDCFALFYESKSRKISALNGSGRAPAALSLERARQDKFQGETTPFHPHAITVPGVPAGWCDLIDKHGSLSMDDILAPAVQLAEEGFPVSPITAYFWQRGAERQLSQAPNSRELTTDGRAPKPGEIFRNPGLAQAFKAISSGGKEAYYQGEIAKAIVEVIQMAGGVMTLDDLAIHTSTWEEPISTTYRDLRLWECPPNGQGLAALLALNILENFDLASLPPLSAERLHLEVEAMRMAFADTRWYVADPNTNPAPLDALLSKDYASQRSRLIDLNRANLDHSYGLPTSGSDTVYLTVVDAQGNACSFINSNYMGFGTGFVPKGWGFTLQNRGAGFSLDPGHPNVLAPRKRPYHTIIPALLTHADTNELFASYGVMGGFMQPQGHMQVAISLIDDHHDPQIALDQPRFCIQNGQADGTIGIEEGISFDVLAKLSSMGHTIIPTTGHGRALFGRGQIILRDRQTGVLWGGSDPRADGLAMANR